MDSVSTFSSNDNSGKNTDGGAGRAREKGLLDSRALRLAGALHAALGSVFVEKYTLKHRTYYIP